VEPNIRKVYSPLVVKRGNSKFSKAYVRAYIVEIGPSKPVFGSIYGNIENTGLDPGRQKLPRKK